MKPLRNFQKNLKNRNAIQKTSPYTTKIEQKHMIKHKHSKGGHNGSNHTSENKRRKPEHTDRTYKRKTWEHIENEQRTQENTQLKDTPPILHQIRQKSQLYKAQRQFPKITHMLLKDYTIQEINNSVKKLKNNKAHGADGIPAESYKTIQTWIAEPLTHILSEIKNGKQLPTTWKNGAVVHIYKTRGMERNATTTGQ